MKKKKRKFYGLLKKIVYAFYGKRELIGLENIPKEPSIIVGNHSQMHGPLIAELHFPYPKKTWCIGEMMNRCEIPEYAMKDFWLYKKKGTRWFYKIISHVIARPFEYIFSSADCIAVYKDARVINTLKQSVSALKNGNYIIIYPESHVAYNHIVNELQDNFIDVARLFYKNTGKKLSFVPMYVAPKLRKVFFGNPIKYDSTLTPDQNKRKISGYIKCEITNMAESLSVHRVVPFDNIPKSKYPYSK